MMFSDGNFPYRTHLYVTFLKWCLTNGDNIPNGSILSFDSSIIFLFLDVYLQINTKWT